MATSNLFIGQAAVQIGIPQWQLRKLADAGVIDVPRVGRTRVFPADRIDDYRKTLREAGHLPAVDSAR